MRPRHELLKYKHKELINEVNEFFITLKVDYIEDIDIVNSLRVKYPKLTAQQLDAMMMRIIHALEEQNEPLIKY